MADRRTAAGGLALVVVLGALGSGCHTPAKPDAALCDLWQRAVAIPEGRRTRVRESNDAFGQVLLTAPVGTDRPAFASAITMSTEHYLLDSTGDITIDGWREYVSRDVGARFDRPSVDRALAIPILQLHAFEYAIMMGPTDAQHAKQAIYARCSE